VAGGRGDPEHLGGVELAQPRAILELLGDADRAVYYYLSDSKRMFRVLLSG
jgi:hypothetical protein